MCEKSAEDFAFIRRQLALEDGRYLVLYDFPNLASPDEEQVDEAKDEEGEAR
jgi:hypothetical protein